jgi:hypothetical protein
VGKASDKEEKQSFETSLSLFSDSERAGMRAREERKSEFRVVALALHAHSVFVPLEVKPEIWVLV